MALQSRVDKLEQRTGARDCPECGGGNPNEPYEVELCWSDDASAPTGPEYCPACGRQLVFTVTWGDDDEQPRAS